jgi:dipeptidyl aminopeptidase/acylaminoacyl peptidase
VYSSGKGNAGMYLVGDRKAKDITFFGARYPEIDDTNYAGKQLVSFKARDGVVIEGYLTLPKQAENKPLATVILPHGGPMARDYGGFDYWSEMLANQGYVVLQPNFRGSSGYGHSFESAAINGWGAAMQDDLQDAAHWMIEKGYTDANRICVVGASYGGYAALMALAKHPETFKCAASFAGVTDLEHIVKRARWFTNKEVVRKQFGTDSEKLEAASPVNLAAKINRPVLLIHGTDDKVVPVAHSREMLDELEDEGKPVKYVELDGGNHHLSYQPHRLTTLTEIVSFLQQHL